MKKFLMIAVMAMSALSMSAQDSKFAAGINADFITASGYTTAGFGLKLQYNFTENFRTELGYTYYLNKDENGIWAINLNFAYLFKVSEKFKVGPMAGLGMNSTHMSSDLKDALAITAAPYEVKNTMALGFQVGVATEYQVSDHFKLGLDAMYKHAKKDGKINENPQWVKYGMDVKGFLLSATAAYCF
jgi:outer membrane protein W